jgi:hypothetical protein
MGSLRSLRRSSEKPSPEPEHSPIQLKFENQGVSFEGVAGENLSVGDVVSGDVSTNIFRKTCARVEPYPLIGVVISPARQGKMARIAISGTISGLSVEGCPVGSTLYISEIPGALTSVSPVTRGTYVKPVGTAISSSVIVLHP